MAILTASVEPDLRLAARDGANLAEGVERHEIDGVRFATCTWQRLLQICAASIAARRRLLVLSGNVQAFQLARRHPWFHDLLERADLVRVDGEGVRLAARLLGDRLPPRRTWADFGWDLARESAVRGHGLFLLGGREGVAERAALELRRREPGLRVAGTHHGFFDKLEGSADSESVLDRIEASSAELLVVGFGMPIQERWIADHLGRIAAPVILTAGAAFDYVSGDVRRPPRWMGRFGLEWLGRLLLEPRRLGRRYLLGNPLFMGRVLRQRWREHRSLPGPGG
jgi:N-acetylglucosaminyldiphosphoundecaprenol N-acetyl-beta-D-mannosaminyltransferase